VFTVSGCYQLFESAKWQQERFRTGLVRLGAVLRELAEANTETKKGANDPVKGIGLTIDSDAKQDD
jgi:hypothetical protein